MGGISLASHRWNRESWFYRDRVFRGHVLDLGGAGDYFGNYLIHFPHVTRCQMVDLEAPEGHLRADLNHWDPEPNSADCVLSSHTLEHLHEPYLATDRWGGAVRLGGYMILIVPSWYTYERERWPSHVNAGHRTAWKLGEPDQLDRLVALERLALELDDLLALEPRGFRLIRATTLDEGFNPADPSDQTANGTCECGLEAVWQRVA